MKKITLFIYLFLTVLCTGCSGIKEQILKFRVDSGEIISVKLADETGKYELRSDPISDNYFKVYEINNEVENSETFILRGIFIPPEMVNSNKELFLSDEYSKATYTEVEISDDAVTFFSSGNGFDTHKLIPNSQTAVAISSEGFLEDDPYYENKKEQYFEVLSMLSFTSEE